MSTQPYVVITADTHAGASIDAYREYLDPAWRAEFDAWRSSYRNQSQKHVGSKKTKSWDSAERRADLQRDGVVGEVIFPNTVPPFYGAAFHISGPPTPEQYPRYLAGTRAHNRWLAEFCADAPERRAGIGLIHLNDLDDAIADVHWIAKHGLRGGVLLPLPAPSDVHLAPLNDPAYDRLWAAIQDCALVINQHSGQGTPRYAEAQGAKALWACEMAFFAQRGFTHLIMGGVFERFPQLRFILTESGSAWAPNVLRLLDGMWLAWKAGAIGEIDTSRDPAPKESPSFYAKRNCWYGASFPGPSDIEGRHVVGVDRILWGSDYPHYEGCFPYSRENMRFAFQGVPEAEVRMMLGENAARLYGFDLAALSAAAAEANVTPALVAQPLEEIPADSTCITFLRARAERAMQGMRT
ncbi:MAG: amidohydrolase family protein [Deltaproteobacteria bacterium]|nr:amidohydrolase family protein [Deltaproteobacteria bacterium]